MSVVLQSVFAALAGRWFLQRRIWQEGINEPLAFVGRAAFALRDNTSYAYEEAGELFTGDGALPVRRRYAFEFDALRNEISVRYWEHGPAAALHILQCNTQLRARHRHVCGDDVYEVTYDFAEVLAKDPSFACTYLVRGPRKAYRMRSVFSRGAIEPS